MTELQQHLQFLASEGYNQCVSSEFAPKIIELLKWKFPKITQEQTQEVLSYILF